MEQLIATPAGITDDRVRVLHVAISPLTLVPLRGQLAYLSAHGFAPTVVAAADPLLETWAARERVPFVPVRVSRELSPVGDATALRDLVAIIRALRPSIVHAHTPKGGLLGMVAATLERVPVRIYHVHGVPDSSVALSRRASWRAADAVSCALATRVVAVGPSVREALLSSQVPASKVAMLAGGSANGVDAARFDSERVAAERDRVRAELGIPRGAFVVGFVGRLARDKGIAPLLHAFAELRTLREDAWLLVVGGEEPHQPLEPAVARELRAGERVRWTGWREDTPALYAAMDAFALLSRREGLPTVVLEAGAMRLPVVVSRAPGCLDAVVEGSTGWAVDAGRPTEVTSLLARLAAEPALRSRMGRAARADVVRRFAPESLWRETERLYRAELERARV